MNGSDIHTVKFFSSIIFFGRSGYLEVQKLWVNKQMYLQMYFEIFLFLIFCQKFEDIEYHGIQDN